MNSAEYVPHVWHIRSVPYMYTVWQWQKQTYYIKKFKREGEKKRCDFNPLRHATNYILNAYIKTDKVDRDVY